MTENIYDKAKLAAIMAHESINQVRKYSGRPYYTHPLEVAELVSTKTDDQEVLVAACLHDILEDVASINPTFNRDWMLASFGERVVSIVEELTNKYTKENYPELSRTSRKLLERGRLSMVSDEAKLIKKADLYHNSIEMDQDDPFTKVWMEEKRMLDFCLGGSWE